MAPPDDQELAGLGRALRELRTKRGWSAADLADASGLQRTYVADLERGARNPTYRTLTKLARALDVSLASLIRRAEKKQ